MRRLPLTLTETLMVLQIARPNLPRKNVFWKQNVNFETSQKFYIDTDLLTFDLTYDVITDLQVN